MTDSKELELDLVNFPRFKKAYNKAVREEEETFNFEGFDIHTNYAKYVIEYFIKEMTRDLN